jgi:hypothetical protein
VKRLIGAALVGALLAACSGHSGGVIPSTPHGSKAATPLNFKIKIPVAPVAPSASGKRAQHVSSATLGVGVTTYAQSDTGHTTSIGYFGNDVSPSSPACTPDGAFRVCSILAAAPAGNDTLVVTTYDQTPNGSGFFDVSANALDTGDVDFDVIEGQTNSVSVTLGGIPAQLDVSIDNPEAVFNTTLYAGMPYNIEYSALDASGAIIIGDDAYAAPLAISTTTGNAVFTIDGTPGTVLTKPDSVVTMVDSSPSHGLPTLTVSGNSLVATANYAVDPLGKTYTYGSSSNPTAIAVGTGSDEVGQPGDLFYADSNEEIVKFDAIMLTNASPLSYTGQSPEAFATTSIVQNRFAGIDVSFVTASDGSNVWIGNSDGTSALMDNTVPATANCTITNASAGDRILACGDTIADADTLAASAFPGRTFGGIVTASDGLLYYGFNDSGGTGGIGWMSPGDIGGSSDSTYATPAGDYATSIVACPNQTPNFIDVRGATTLLGQLASGGVALYSEPGPMTALTCGPNDDLYFGTDSGDIYRFSFATNTATLISSTGGSIGGMALGPDGAIWATNTPQSELLRIIP